MSNIKTALIVNLLCAVYKAKKEAFYIHSFLLTKIVKLSN